MLLFCNEQPAYAEGIGFGEDAGFLAEGDLIIEPIIGLTFITLSGIDGFGAGGELDVITDIIGEVGVVYLINME